MTALWLWRCQHDGCERVSATVDTSVLRCAYCRRRATSKLLPPLLWPASELAQRMWEENACRIYADSKERCASCGERGYDYVGDDRRIELYWCSAGCWAAYWRIGYAGRREIAGQLKLKGDCLA